MPFSVRCYIAGLVAVAVAAIATLPLSRTSWRLLLALCALVVAAELLSRVRIGTSGWTMSISLVVTLITVVVLAPPAAALVGLVSSVPLHRRPTWTWTKQIINSAMTTVVPAAAAGVCYLAGGHASGHFLNFPVFLWPAAAAVTTCLLGNALIIAGYMGLATHGRFIDAMRGDVKRATMPYYSSAVLALIFLSLWDDIGWYTAPLVVVPMYIAHWSLSQYAKEGAAHEGTIAALVQAVEIKDSYTRGHSERVARGAEMLAQQLKMPQDRLAMLRFAGLLHDIGKLGVPTRLLTSTGGLTEEEFKLLCMHPNHGVAVLRDIRFLTEVYEGVLYHHERLDGRGYPTGKSGDDIPEFARIIGVADAFDAMTSTRSYRAARSVEEAVAELRRGAGTQFDPDLVRAFEAALERAKESGNPWLPTELAPAQPPQGGETATAVPGPWPLPKRVPGFSFADHDDPFVPVEWFSDWYPSWLAHGGEPGVGDGDGDDGGSGPGGPGGGPVAELTPGIPGQRAGEPEAAGGASGAVEDFDDGWSERMHSAVVREAGPEGDEGWEWYRDPAEDAHAEPAAASEGSERWPVDPGLHGDPRGSMRVRAATPDTEPEAGGSDPAEQGAVSQAAEPDSAPPRDDRPAGSADFDLRKPVGPGSEAGAAGEPWSGLELTVQTPKAADPAGTPISAETDLDAGRTTPPLASSRFSHGAGGASPTLHFFGAGDTSPWPPRDSDAKDAEESPA